MTAPTTSTATVDQAQAAADRREAQIHVLETAVALAVTAALTARLARIGADLQRAYLARLVDPTRWWYARQGAAQAVAGITVDLGSSIGRHLDRAARLGANHAGAALPVGHVPAADGLTARALADVDAQARARLAQTARALLTAPIETPAQLAAVVEGMDAAPRHVQGVAGDAVARAVGIGAVAAAARAGVALVLIAERDACLNCQGMNGAVAEPGALFFPVRTFAPRPMPWLADGITSTPCHNHCRCHLAPATEGLPEALRRESQREVAQGRSAYDSLPARLHAVDRLLRSTTLPKTVQERARADRAAGRFTRPRPGPATKKPA